MTDVYSYKHVVIECEYDDDDECSIELYAEDSYNQDGLSTIMEETSSDCRMESFSSHSYSDKRGQSLTSLSSDCFLRKHSSLPEAGIGQASSDHTGNTKDLSRYSESDGQATFHLEDDASEYEEFLVRDWTETINRNDRKSIETSLDAFGESDEFTFESYTTSDSVFSFEEFELGHDDEDSKEHKDEVHNSIPSSDRTMNSRTRDDRFGDLHREQSYKLSKQLFERLKDCSSSGTKPCNQNNGKDPKKCLLPAPPTPHAVVIAKPNKSDSEIKRINRQAQREQRRQRLFAKMEVMEEILSEFSILILSSVHSC
jgi:hypothetical protein